MDEFRAIPGKGAEGRIDGTLVAVVSPGYLAETGTPFPEGADVPSDTAATTVFVLRDGAVAGAISLSDMIRPESAEAVRRLQEMGIEPIMLTGDDSRVASSVAARLGIERYFSEVLPADKANMVERIRAEGNVVAMVGDGVNDAPSLATADIGLAIGAGTDVAVSTADVVLVRSDPRDVPTVIELARATYAKMRQNLAWATGYNVIAIPLAAGVLAGSGIVLSPAVGGALMALSTIVVAINARMLRIHRV